MLFKEFTDLFLKISADNGNSAGEIKQKEMCIRNHLGPYFAQTRLEDIGIPEVREYKTSKLADGYSPKTINNHLLILSKLLSTARDERVLHTEKFPIKSVPLKYMESRFMDGSEIKRLLSAARIERNKLWVPLIIMALNTGMRIGELLALNWNDVDLAARRLTVRHSLCRTSGCLKCPKNGMNRDVVLTEDAAKALDALPHRVGRVFDCAYETAYKALRNIAANAGLENIGWHTMRHTFASLLVMEGTPLIVVSRLLGHASVKTTERYSHLLRDSQTDAMAKLTVALGG